MFQAVQQWIECSGTDSIPVPSQLADHSQPKHRLPRRMMQNVKSNKSRVEVLVRHGDDWL